LKRKMDAEEWIELSTFRQSARWFSSITPKKASGDVCQRLTINRLPDVMLLQIFSVLPPTSLGRAAQVCRHWRNISEDEYLWRKKIRQELFSRQFVNHKLSPVLFRPPHHPPILPARIEREYRTNRASSTTLRLSSKTPKQLYVKFFEEAKERRNAGKKSGKRTFIWKSISHKNPKKIVLYGEGLKNLDNSRRLLQFLLGVSKEAASTTPFKVTGMVPGGCRGVVPILDFLLNGRSGILGAWISLEFKGQDFTLVTICEANNAHSIDGLLVKNDSPPSTSSPISPSFVPSGSAAFTSKLSPKFHQLFDDADGFVCVIDARNIITPVVTTNSTTGASTERSTWEEELSVLSKNCHSSHLRMKAAPLLVLPLTNAEETSQCESDSIFQFVQALNQKNLMVGRPWQVNCVDPITMDGVTCGFEWILQ